MLKRLRRLYELSKKDPAKLDALTEKEIEAIPEECDGKAEFLGEGTHQEFEDQKKADKGFKHIFGIGL